MVKANVVLAGLMASMLVSSLYMANGVLAHCPLCTAATAAVVAAARFYGVDDLIVGTFVGGAIISTGYWANNWLNKRSKGKGYLKYQLTILNLMSYVTIVSAFYFAGFLGDTSAKYTIFGISKLLIGSSIGSVISIVAFSLHDMLRSYNYNRNYIPFQAIVLAILMLAMTSGIFYAAGWVSL